MARKGENIYKRKDGRWEGRYIKSRSSTGKANYGYVYARNRKKWVIVGNLGAQKAKRNDTPISAKKDIMGDKTVRVRADLHHIIKIETAKNGGNVKEVMEIRLRSKLKSVLIVHYLKILYNRNWS